MANIRAQQQYSLRWNNYLRHITFSFDELKSNGDLVDVTLCCDGQKIRAHKVLLSACSAYFKEIFKDNPHPHPVIVFKFIKFEDLNAIIQFIYQGEVNVQQDALQSFLQTAELLAIQGLTTEDKASKDQNPLGTNENKTITKILPSTIQTISNNINACGGTATTTYTLDHQQQPITNLTKRRKLSTNTKNDVQATFAECITFTKDDTGLVKSTEMQYLPTTVKVDIPELIHVPDITQQIINEQETQTIDKMNVKSEGSQYTTEYEILEDSQIIDDKIHNEQNIQMSLDPGDEVSIGPFAQTEQTENDGDKTNSNTSTNKWAECSYCKMTITSVNLWRHVRTQHTPEPPKICELCSKHFKNKYSLREHIRITHEQKQKS